jgi:chloramphenicol 3-O phosphotransferase
MLQLASDTAGEEKGKIIWLNGFSSSGKSTLAKALQKMLQQPYFCIAQDTFTDIISPWCEGTYNGIDGQQLWYDSIECMYHTIKLYSDLGRNVIVDHVIIRQDDGREQAYFERARILLGENPVLFVKVNCSLEALQKRERERGDREIGNAQWQYYKGLYPLNGYHCEVDTSIDSICDCAKIIVEKLL